MHNTVSRQLDIVYKLSEHYRLWYNHDFINPQNPQPTMKFRYSLNSAQKRQPCFPQSLCLYRLHLIGVLTSIILLVLYFKIGNCNMIIWHSKNFQLERWLFPAFRHIWIKQVKICWKSVCNCAVLCSHARYFDSIEILHKWYKWYFNDIDAIDYGLMHC